MECTGIAKLIVIASAMLTYGFNLRDGSESKKRSYQPDNDDVDGSLPKRRFVWPKSLHNDFISAVFDIGLQSAKFKEVQFAINSMDPSAFSVDQLRSHMQKFRIFRDRKRLSRKSFYESAQEGGSDPDENCMEHFSTAVPVESSSSLVDLPGRQLQYQHHQHLPLDKLMRILAGEETIDHRQVGLIEESCDKFLHLLQRQVEKTQQAMHSQQKFLEHMQTSLGKQFNVLGQVDALLQEANALTSEPSSQGSADLGDSSGIGLLFSQASSVPVPVDFPGAENHSSHINSTHSNGDVQVAGVGGKAAASNGRTELTIMSEMRATMDWHRKLLSKRRDQLSQHGHSEFVMLPTYDATSNVPLQHYSAVPPPYVPSPVYTHPSSYHLYSQQQPSLLQQHHHINLSNGIDSHQVALSQYYSVNSSSRDDTSPPTRYVPDLAQLPQRYQSSSHTHDHYNRSAQFSTSSMPSPTSSTAAVTVAGSSVTIKNEEDGPAARPKVTESGKISPLPAVTAVAVTHATSAATAAGANFDPDSFEATELFSFLLNPE